MFCAVCQGACCLTGLCSVTCSGLFVKVRDVSENPLARPETTKHHSDDPQMETRILENSINKICSLLAVGFGDAGAEVIANNIRSGGDLNPMIPGNKVVAIFGFCDIRNFTDTTEVLQEDIMEFVNTIADIVHTEVSSGKFSILARAIDCDTSVKAVCSFRKASASSSCAASVTTIRVHVIKQHPGIAHLLQKVVGCIQRLYVTVSQLH